MENNNAPQITPKKSPAKKGFPIGWAILGFCSPMLGLIIFFCMKKNEPRSAKWAAIGAIIGVFMIVVMLILIMVFPELATYLTILNDITTDEDYMDVDSLSQIQLFLK